TDDTRTALGSGPNRRRWCGAGISWLHRMVRTIFHQNAWLTVPMIQLRTHTAQTRRWWEHGSPHNTNVSVIANRGKSLPTPAQETAHHMREVRTRIRALATHASLSV